jgi:uncharacterized cupredoxin-like copper-binding protein
VMKCLHLQGSALQYLPHRLRVHSSQSAQWSSLHGFTIDKPVSKCAAKHSCDVTSGIKDSVWWL